MIQLLNITLLATIALVMSGCATAKKSDFLSDYDRLHRGLRVERYWSAAGLNRQALAHIYVEPVDTSRVKEEPKIALGDASNWLKTAMEFSMRRHPELGAVDQPEKSTSRLCLAITRVTPGSSTGRIVAGELGLGHAILQVEGKLVDSRTGAELACFTDRRRDSAAAGIEDLGGDVGPDLVKRMIEHIARDFVEELSSSAVIPRN
jgi:hypothetical protein